MVSTCVGYAGGFTAEPTYRQVCAGRTGHAEVVQVEFDPSVITFERLLALFFEMHNPAREWRTDPHDQYRSAIFTTTPGQLATALSFKQLLDVSSKYRRGVSTEVRPLERFWLAEDYHQKYYEKRGIGACRI